MYITPCPKCGRKPVIYECMPTKTGTRRRLIHCPNFCTIFQTSNTGWITSNSMFIYYGEGDNNTIYKEYNKRILDNK